MRLKIISIFLLFVLGSMTYAQTYSDSMSAQQKKEWINSNLGIDIIGEAFSYNPSTGILEVSGSTRAMLPGNFRGVVNAKDGATVNIGENFFGRVKVNNGNVEMQGKGTFKGTAEYSAHEGFSIEKGEILLPNLARVPVSNANNVVFEGSRVSGRAGRNAIVNNQALGENTLFEIDTSERAKVRLIGEPSKTTLPNGDVRKVSSKYYIGNMELDSSSLIYLKAGDKMKFEGKTLFAKNRDLLIYFERQGNFIKPFLRYYPTKETNVQIRAGKRDNSEVAAERWVNREEKATKRNLDKSIMDEKLGQVSIIGLIEDSAAENNVEPAAAKAFISVESNGRTNVVNYQGRPSFGLGQISEIAVDELNSIRAKKGLPLYDKKQVISDPAVNARASIEYYSLMLHRFYGNDEAAIVAYSYGEGRASQFYSKRANDNTDKPLKDTSTLKAAKALPKSVKLHVAKFKEFKKKYQN